MNDTFTLDQIRRAFWATFHRKGEVWFNYLGSDEECEGSTEDEWETFRSELNTESPSSLPADPAKPSP